MNVLPRPALFYIALIFGLALAAVLASVGAIIAQPGYALYVVGIAVVIAALDLYPVSFYSKLTNNIIEFTTSVAVKFAAILLLPPPVVVLGMFFGTLLAENWLGRVWYKVMFNVGMMTIQCAVVAVLYRSLYDPSVPLLGSAQNLFALVMLGVGDFLLNSVLVALVIALATGTAVYGVWLRSNKSLFLHELSMLPIGVFIYILWQYSPWTIILAALPLFVMRHSYQLIADLERQTREALAALARVLDERDQHTAQHSEKVSEHSGLIAREMGLPPEQVETIMLAATMHDIGKVGMRNDILFKQGALTPEERELAKRHAALGGELLEKFPLFQKGAIYVRHHHERWDGAGYPDGLKGQAIPVGARILAVADSFQAMTEQRPYRDPLPLSVALNQLREGSGTQFDPEVVAAFLRVHKHSANVPNPEPSVVVSPLPLPVAEGVQVQP